MTYGMAMRRGHLGHAGDAGARRGRSRGLWVAGALGSVAALLLTAGCDGASTAAPTAGPTSSVTTTPPAASPTATPWPALDAAAVTAASTLTVGAVVAHLAPAPGVTVSSVADADGSVRSTLTWDDTADLTAPLALTTADGTDVATALTDGTGVLHDASGAFRAGVVVSNDGGTGRLTAATAPGVLAVTIQDTAASQLVLWWSASTVAGTSWGDREGGRSLAVSPTAWARRGGLAAEEGLRVQLPTLEPEAASSSMLDQLSCHLLGAPDKETWNLEPWRPDVSGLDMLLAQCNPS